MDHTAWQLAGIFFLTWLSEDAAVLGAGLAAATGSLPLIPCFLSCFWGLWTGDFLLYLIARHGGRPLAERFFGKGSGWSSKLEKSEEWFRTRGILALAVSRFVPGLRLTTFLAAGFLAMNAALFLAVTGIMSAVWTLLVFLLTRLLGSAAPEVFQALKGHLFLILGGSLLILGSIHLLPLLVRNLSRWEFWPAKVLYAPVALKYAWLSLRYFSPTLPSAANPGIRTGGLVGESKWETLWQLRRISPEHVPATALIPTEGDRSQELERFMSSSGLSFPLVLKPDLAFRGSGFRIVRDSAQASEYLASVPLPVIAQDYIPGPLEAGIYYCRFPDEDHGRILAVTEKVFPSLTGDGTSTLRHLIESDSRASCQANMFRKRFAGRLEEILPAGASLKLVEAGNHAQGCIFHDGMHLLTPALVETIDSISRSLSGFSIGRYDIRYASSKELSEGRFQILELNGVAGEPTSAYDATRSLTRCYSLLFHHWELAFSIGAANRRLGHRPIGIRQLLTEWRAYRRLSALHPTAD